MLKNPYTRWTLYAVTIALHVAAVYGVCVGTVYPR